MVYHCSGARNKAEKNVTKQISAEKVVKTRLDEKYSVYGSGVKKVPFWDENVYTLQFLIYAPIRVSGLQKSLNTLLPKDF